MTPNDLAEASLQERIQKLEAELSAERTRKKALFQILIGTGSLELGRFLGPLAHPSFFILGAVFCFVYLLYGLYLYSTQEPF